MLRQIDSGKLRLFITALVAVMVLGLACISQAATTQSTSPLDSKDVEKAETAAGDLVADAIRAYAKADAAFVAGSELTPSDQPIPAGKVSSSDLAGLISFRDDSLAVLQLTGAQVRAALEKSISIYPQPNVSFLQVSGIRFTFAKAAGGGGQITSLTINGSPVDESRSYTVAVTNSLANGSLGYRRVWSKDSNILKRLPDATILTAIDSFFAANPKIDYSRLDRITAK